MFTCSHKNSPSLFQDDVKMEVLTSLSLLLHKDNPQKEYNSLKLFESGLAHSLLTVLGEEKHAQVWGGVSFSSYFFSD